jgi:hypothetical protein
MDPVENLKHQLELVEAILDTGDFLGDDLLDRDECGIELAMLVQGLDDWRSKGGFDPYRIGDQATHVYAVVRDEPDGLYLFEEDYQAREFADRFDLPVHEEILMNGSAGSQFLIDTFDAEKYE